MIELRWFERLTGKSLVNEWGCYYDETERVLQQRVSFLRDRWTTDGVVVKEMAWTDWTDIPTVKE
jgi:hypothetical protein